MSRSDNYFVRKMHDAVLDWHTMLYVIVLVACGIAAYLNLTSFRWVGWIGIGVFATLIFIRVKREVNRDFS